jgi:hypothetical protein
MKPTITPQNKPFQDSNKGSSLVLVIVFTTFLLILLASALPMTVTSYRLSLRDHLVGSALSLAEGGAEMGLSALNTHKSTEAWESAGWGQTDDGLYWTRVIPVPESNSSFLGNRVSGEIRLLVSTSQSGRNAQILSHSTVERAGNGNEPVSRLVVLTARRSSAYDGLIALNRLRANGQPTYDSYDSREFLTYNPLFRRHNVTVGSISDAAGSVDMKNAHIFGNVISGAASPIDDGAVDVNLSRVTGEVTGGVYYDFPDVEAPNTTGWNTSF